MKIGRTGTIEIETGTIKAKTGPKTSIQEGTSKVKRESLILIEVLKRALVTSLLLESMSSKLISEEFWQGI